MGLGTVSVCLTVLVLNLHHRDAELPVPKWAKVLFLRYLARILCVRARRWRAPVAAVCRPVKPRAGAAAADQTQPAEEGGGGGGDRGLLNGLRLQTVARRVGLVRRPMKLPNGHHATPNRYVTNEHGDVTDSLCTAAPAVTTTIDCNTEEMHGDDDPASDWKEVAHVLDRLFFWFVFLSMTASAMIILLVPYYKEEIRT